MGTIRVLSRSRIGHFPGTVVGGARERETPEATKQLLGSTGVVC